jgi:hypothetical protein
MLALERFDSSQSSQDCSGLVHGERR